MIRFAIIRFSVVVALFKCEFPDRFRCPLAERWLRLFREIQTGYDLMRQERFLEARILLGASSRVVTTNLSDSMDCSIGVASLFRALAHSYVGDTVLAGTSPAAFRRANQVGLRMMHVAMNWLTHAFVRKGSNQGRWVDESAWPLSISEINQEQTLFMNNIGATGPHGHRPTRDTCPTSFRDPSLTIAIVSVCDYPPDNPLPALSRSNRELYSKKHGYRLIERNRRLDESRPHAWAKISLLRHYILSADIDWLLWFDCDTYFMNFDITLDHLLHKYGELPNGTLDPEFRMLIQEDHAMINTGVFFIKTGQWSEKFLERVYGDQNSPWINHPWWEQAAISHEFLSDIGSRMEHSNLSNLTSANDMSDIYPDEVKVAPQSLFNSYHPITSRVFMHDNWEPGKFVLAFSGCLSGSSPAIVKVLYLQYYQIMCELNNVTKDCLPVNELPN